MKTRTMICKQCGKLVNSSRQRCICGSGNLEQLSYESASASAQIKNDNERLSWFEKGALYARKGNRRKKWFPVK